MFEQYVKWYKDIPHYRPHHHPRVVECWDLGIIVPKEFYRGYLGFPRGPWIFRRTKAPSENQGFPIGPRFPQRNLYFQKDQGFL